MTVRIDKFTRDGLTFDVLDSGPIDGPVVVLLHGFPERAASWKDVSAILHGEGFRTVAPDQRGYSPGARPGRRRDYRIGELVGDVVGLIDKIGNPVHLAGHDWGSMVAWCTALARPDLVRTLTAFSVPHPGAFVRAGFASRQLLHSWYFAFFQLPVIPEKWLGGGGDKAVGWLMRSGIGPEGLERINTDTIEYGALRGAVNWYRGLPFSDPRPFGKAVTVPTTMVWSDNDMFIGRAGIDRTAAYVSAPYSLVVLPGVSHWIPTQAPAEAADAILSRATD